MGQTLSTTLTVYISLVVLVASGANGVSLRKNNGIPKGYKSLGSGYFVSESGFDYFFANGSRDPSKWNKLKGVSGDLNDLKAGYACSAFSCYFRGTKFSVAGDLKVLKYGITPTRYASDAFNAYYDGVKIRGAAGEMEPVSLYYGKDAFNSFFQGVKMKGVVGDVKSLGSGYATDDMNNLFYRANKIGNAVNFKRLDGGYAVSSNDCYYLGKKIGSASPGGGCANLKTFKVDGKSSSWAKGDGKIYHKGKEFSHAMGKDVSPLGGGYVKVGHKFFYKGAETAAHISLKVFGNTGYAVDAATKLYYNGEWAADGVVGFNCEDGDVYCGAGHIWFYKGMKMDQHQVMGLKPYDYGFAANRFYVFFEGEMFTPRFSGGQFSCLSEPGYCGYQGNWYYGAPGKKPIQFKQWVDFSVKDGKVVDSQGNQYVHGKKV